MSIKARRHEVHLFENGTASIRDTVLGETMHSQVGPDQEARQVHLLQAGLSSRLSAAEPSNPEQSPPGLPLVLHDIGMGIASNALAAIELAMQLPCPRPLHIISFENSSEGLELALESPDRFPTQHRHREKLETLLSRRDWKSAHSDIRWELRMGDFREQNLTPEPEVIFYDFYSPKTSPELWELRNFQRLFEACQRRRRTGAPTVLTTYSAATFVRSALLLAGFHVGYGNATDLKSETTIASTFAADIERPLGSAWLQKLRRSSQPFPPDVSRGAQSQALERILSHPQFQSP